MHTCGLWKYITIYIYLQNSTDIFIYTYIYIYVFIFKYFDVMCIFTYVCLFLGPEISSIWFTLLLLCHVLSQISPNLCRSRSATASFRVAYGRLVSSAARRGVLGAALVATGRLKTGQQEDHDAIWIQYIII